MRALLFSLAPLAAVAACDFYPEGGETEPVRAEACDPAVQVPAGNLQGEPVPALRHEEVYGAAPTPTSIHLSWPHWDTSKSIAVVWSTDVDTRASLIEYGPTEGWPDNAVRVEGYTVLYGGGTVGEGTEVVHEVRLCGVLEPNTDYTYRVGGEQAWSSPYTFATPGEPGTFDTFRVALAGDSRGAYETWGNLLAAMDAEEPDFFVFSGDMVELGVTQTEWDAWFAASQEVLARKVLVPVHGNHEFLAQHYFAQWSLPEPEEYFHLEYGDLSIVSLNDTVADPTLISNTQVNFMNEVFGATTMRSKLVTHHQPIYSTCTRHGSAVELRQDWEPVYDTHEVDLVLAGHNHIYERSVPIRNAQEVAPGDGTVYLVSGGAGAPLYQETEGEWFGEVANPTEHYIIADFGPTSIDAVVKTLDGTVIDQFSIPR